MRDSWPLDRQRSCQPIAPVVWIVLYDQRRILARSVDQPVASVLKHVSMSSKGIEVTHELDIKIDRCPIELAARTGIYEQARRIQFLRELMNPFAVWIPPRLVDL